MAYYTSCSNRGIRGLYWSVVSRVYDDTGYCMSVELLFIPNGFSISEHKDMIAGMEAIGSINGLSEIAWVNDERSVYTRFQENG